MNVLRRMAGSMGSWLLRRSGKRLSTGGEWPGEVGGFLDQWGTLRKPTPAALVREFDSTAYACVMINAQSVAAVPYRLLVATRAGDRAPRVRTRPVGRKTLAELRRDPYMATWLGKAVVIEEVESHPLLDLLNCRLLLEMGIYLEIVGQAPWVIETAGKGPLADVPRALYTLPAHQVEVKGGKGTTLQEPVSGFKWGDHTFGVDEIVWHRFPSPADPLLGYSSPAKASWEALGLQDKQISKLHSSLDNDSIPSVLISPKGGGDPVSMDGGVLGADEAKALEARLIKKFRRSSGKLAVSTTQLQADVLNVTPRDQQLADFFRIAHETTARNFAVPLAMLTTNTNLANLQAARQQHAEQAIEPRCKLFDETINNQLVPLFDDTGRLALVHDSPVPEDVATAIKQRESRLKTGWTLNEIRADEGEELIDGPEGDERWVPTSLQRVVIDMGAAPPAKPKPEPEPPEPEQEEDEKTVARETRESREKETDRREAAFLILAGHCAGEISREQAIDALAELGVPFEAIEPWLMPADLVDEDWQKHVLDHHDPPEGLRSKAGYFTDRCREHCAAVTRKGWDEATDTGDDGHERHLPAGQKLTRILRRMFAEQEKAVFQQLGLKLFSSPATRNLEPGTATAKQEISEQLLANLNPNIDLSAWNDELAEDARPVLMIEAEKGARDANIRLGATDVEAVWRVQLPEVEEAVREWSFTFSASTNATTADSINVAITRLRNEIAAGILDGDNTLAELTKRVHAVFAGASRYRAKVIAATEASRAVHAGQAIAAKQSGMVAGFRWLASSDACPLCLSVASEHPNGVMLGEAFADDGGTTDYSLTMYPPLHPWCACTVTEILKPLSQVDPGGGWQAGPVPEDVPGPCGPRTRGVVGKAATCSVRAKRALASHKPMSKEKERIATESERRVASAVGGARTEDNKPFDVLLPGHGVEVKTIIHGDNPKITMHKDSLARKVAFAKQNKIKAHTVVLHHQTGKTYYRDAVGSFRLSAMTELPGGLADLTAHITGAA